MEKLDGVAAAYVNNDIAIHLSEDTTLDKDAVTEAIKEFGMKVKSVKKAEKLPF
ncbi:MAG: hypothetical protein Q7Q71_13600 [Verrucomicrobiota bacterium JB023]|nr:hypothetical protein [Verrucomicrobiota bacterium JB023]